MKRGCRALWPRGAFRAPPDGSTGGGCLRGSVVVDIEFVQPPNKVGQKIVRAMFLKQTPLTIVITTFFMYLFMVVLHEKLRNHGSKGICTCRTVGFRGGKTQRLAVGCS